MMILMESIHDYDDHGLIPSVSACLIADIYNKDIDKVLKDLVKLKDKLKGTVA